MIKEEGAVLKEQGSFGLPFMPDFRAVAEQNNDALKRVFKGRIKGCFLIDIKDQVMMDLGLDNLMKYYDFCWSDERMITGIGEAAEYDICRMIVGIHKAHSIFLSNDEIRKNERSRRYKQQLVSEAIEKIKLRFYGSVYFRKNTLFSGEEFLYYPLPYELFAMSSKMSEMLMDGHDIHCWQLYYGVIYNGLSALSLLEDNMLGTAYPKEFNALFEKRVRQDLKARADYLHFGWVDFIDGYHKTVKKYPYSINGIITFLKDKNEAGVLEIEQLGDFYKSCHAYTHGSIQTAKYPVLHYFEISIMLYYVVRGTFLLMCREKGVEALVDGNDVISMIDRDFEVLHEQYKIRSTEMFEMASNEGLCIYNQN